MVCHQLVQEEGVVCHQLVQEEAPVVVHKLVQEEAPVVGVDGPVGKMVGVDGAALQEVGR